MSAGAQKRPLHKVLEGLDISERTIPVMNPASEPATHIASGRDEANLGSRNADIECTLTCPREARESVALDAGVRSHLAHCGWLGKIRQCSDCRCARRRQTLICTVEAVGRRRSIRNP